MIVRMCITIAGCVSGVNSNTQNQFFITRVKHFAHCAAAAPKAAIKRPLPPPHPPNRLSDYGWPGKDALSKKLSPPESSASGAHEHPRANH